MGPGLLRPEAVACATRRGIRGCSAACASGRRSSTSWTKQRAAAYAKDEESCGLLLRPSDDATLLDEAVPMVNRAAALHAMDPETYPRTARMYFDLDPLKFARAIEQGESERAPCEGALPFAPRRRGLLLGDGRRRSEDGRRRACLRSRVPRDEREGVWRRRPQALRVEPHGTKAFVETALRVDPMKRAGWLVARGVGGDVPARPARAEVRELATRVADAYRAAGGRVVTLPTRFLYEDETLVIGRSRPRREPAAPRSR